MTAALLKKKSAQTPAQTTPPTFIKRPTTLVAPTAVATNVKTGTTQSLPTVPAERLAKSLPPLPAKQSRQSVQAPTIAAKANVQTTLPAAQNLPQNALQSQSQLADEGFAALGLRPELVRAVLAHGYTKPTPIQTQAIPVVLKGGDVLGGAQTGTGKTAGFVLPMLQRLLENSHAKPSKAPRVLVLTPTRELAAQVEESVRIYGKYVPLQSTVIFGGVGMPQQMAALRKGVDIVVATPGRLLDHHGQKNIDLSKVEIFVLDEADRMLDMGFIHDIKRVLAVLPAKRQNLLFSATFSDEIKALADKLLNQPSLIEVARRNSTVEVVAQSVVMAEKSQKSKLLQRLVIERKWTQVLVFTRTKHGANRLAEQLTKANIPALAIHGNKSQGARTRALSEFKNGSLQVLVATDIAARGIDIDQLPQVVNYELPNVPEDYVHRIGRTGRAGATGQALSLVSREELPLLKDIEKFTKQNIAKVEIEGFELSAAEPPDEDDRSLRRPNNSGRGGNGRANQGASNRNNRPGANVVKVANIATVNATAGAAKRPTTYTARNDKNHQIGNRNTQRGRTR